ncbi:HAMP domain-containing histidine kinase [bacterium]|nr:HAMP domain-containing histidine kinase [bacterium]
MNNHDRKHSFILFLIGILPFLYLITDLWSIDPNSIKSIDYTKSIIQMKKDIYFISAVSKNESNLFFKKIYPQKPFYDWQDFLYTYRRHFDQILLLDSQKQILYSIDQKNIKKTTVPFAITNYYGRNKKFSMYDPVAQKKWTTYKKGTNSIENTLNETLSSPHVKWSPVSSKLNLNLKTFYIKYNAYSQTRAYRVCQLRSHLYPDENYTIFFRKKPNHLLEKFDEKLSKSFPDYLVTISHANNNQKVKLRYHFLTEQDVKKLQEETTKLIAKVSSLNLNSKLNKSDLFKIDSLQNRISKNSYILNKRKLLDQEKLFRYKIFEVDLNQYKITLYDNKSPWFRVRLKKLSLKPEWQLTALFLCPIFILFVLFYRYAKKDETYLLQNDWIDYLAHEIQTPIHGINICTELLPTSNDKKLIELIQSQATQLNHVAKAFVRSVQTQKFQLIPRKEKSSLNHIIQNSWDMVHKVHEHKEPYITIEGGQVKFLLDPKMFQEIFINLFDNSCKYCDQQPIINVQVIDFEKNISIIIKDNGIGIEKKYHRKIIQKSYRIQNQWNLGVTGSGMGLYLIHNMVKAHEGIFNIEQSNSEGTIFKIDLPK